MGKLSAKADGLGGSGATALFVALDGKSNEIIAISDPIKPATQAALDSLGSDSIHVVMLTPGSRVEVHMIPTNEEVTITRHTHEMIT